MRTAFGWGSYKTSLRTEFSGANAVLPVCETRTPKYHGNVQTDHRMCKAEPLKHLLSGSVWLPLRLHISCIGLFTCYCIGTALCFAGVKYLYVILKDASSALEVHLKCIGIMIHGWKNIKGEWTTVKYAASSFVKILVVLKPHWWWTLDLQ